MPKRWDISALPATKRYSILPVSFIPSGGKVVFYVVLGGLVKVRIFGVRLCLSYPVV